MTDTFEIELTAMAHGGSALGRHNKQTVFIPYTIPGEVVEARIHNSKGRVAFADGVRLLEASADRVFPRCPHFGPSRCGRCHWQHINYAAQLLIKQDILADQLARIGGFEDTAVLPMIRSSIEWSYNYHMTFDIVEDQVGFSGAGNAPLAIIEECHLMHPELLDLYNSLELAFNGIQQVRLQIGTKNDMMIVLALKDENNVPELALNVPASINMLLPDHEPINLAGSTHTVYDIADHKFRVTAGSAIRANIAQIPTLTQVIVALLDLPHDAAVLDLYAGVGIFSAALAKQASLVTLVESFPPAVTDADENLADLDNVDVIEGTVEGVLAALNNPYTAAVLDPPPYGLSVDVIDLLVEAQIPRLIYVSSDPATLARDAKRLVQQGYTMAVVQPIDFSPQTFFIDSVAVFDL